MGVVTHVGPDHLGIDVYSAFHAVLPVEHLAEQYVYQNVGTHSNAQWTDRKGGEAITQGRQIRLVVLSVQPTHHGLFFIRTSIDPKERKYESDHALGLVPIEKEIDFNAPLIQGQPPGPMLQSPRLSSPKLGGDILTEARRKKRSVRKWGAEQLLAPMGGFGDALMPALPLPPSAAMEIEESEVEALPLPLSLTPTMAAPHVPKTQKQLDVDDSDIEELAPPQSQTVQQVQTQGEVQVKDKAKTVVEESSDEEREELPPPYTQPPNMAATSTQQHLDNTAVDGNGNKRNDDSVVDSNENGDEQLSASKRESKKRKERDSGIAMEETEKKKRRKHKSAEKKKRKEEKKGKKERRLSRSREDGYGDAFVKVEPKLETPKREYEVHRSGSQSKKKKKQKMREQQDASDSMPATIVELEHATPLRETISKRKKETIKKRKQKSIDKDESGKGGQTEAISEFLAVTERKSKKKKKDKSGKKDRKRRKSESMLEPEDDANNNDGTENLGLWSDNPAPILSSVEMGVNGEVKGLRSMYADALHAVNLEVKNEDWQSETGQEKTSGAGQESEKSRKKKKKKRRRESEVKEEVGEEVRPKKKKKKKHSKSRDKNKMEDV